MFFEAVAQERVEKELIDRLFKACTGFKQIPCNWHSKRRFEASAVAKVYTVVTQDNPEQRQHKKMQDFYTAITGFKDIYPPRETPLPTRGASGYRFLICFTTSSKSCVFEAQ